ncbi:MAG: hypothetical protein HC898_08450 [Phycisphaerales bacterium]|nr:hypothetical protein [Phycisphaerales bacterium]
MCLVVAKKARCESGDGWWFSHQAAEGDGAGHAYWGEHGLDLQRYYMIVCLLYGSDPEAYREFADDAELPAERQQDCPAEFEQVARSWGVLLDQHIDQTGNAGSSVSVIYGDAPGNLQGMRDIIEAPDSST